MVILGVLNKPKEFDFVVLLELNRMMFIYKIIIPTIKLLSLLLLSITYKICYKYHFDIFFEVKVRSLYELKLRL